MSELFIAMDCESGGLADEVSLLSAYFGIFDEDFNQLGELDILVKPNDGLYKVEAQGLDTNKIDLIAHDKVALTYGDAGQQVFKLIQQHSQDGNIKLIPLGKNVKGDINWINKHLLGKKTWNRFVSYRDMDISPLARALQLKGRIPRGMGLSLFSLAQHFQVLSSINGNPHEAKYDTLVTVAVFIKMLEML